MRYFGDVGFAEGADSIVWRNEMEIDHQAQFCREREKRHLVVVGGVVEFEVDELLQGEYSSMHSASRAFGGYMCMRHMLRYHGEMT